MTLRFLHIFAACAAGLTLAGSATAATLVDDSTTGYYNDSIGTSLDSTNPYGKGYSLFPTHETKLRADFGPSDVPDLTKASSALGSWLTDPAKPGGAWSSAPVAIPATWARHSETAIIYAIDAGTRGLQNVIGSFGIDNGLFVWLNGTFIGGHVRPGFAIPGEFRISLGTLRPGKNYLQLLREDHGVLTGYSVSVTGDPATVAEPAPVPLPASGLLLIAGIGGLVATRRRKSA